MVDWHSVATSLADRGKGSAVLDRSGRIQLLGAPLGRLLGRSPAQARGLSWVEVVTAPEAAAEMRQHIGQALAGRLGAFETIAATVHGARVRLAVDTAALLGFDGTHALLLTVTASEAIVETPAAAGVDEDYEIDAGIADFGRLRVLRSRDEPPVPATDARCYAYIRGERTPCVDCPALAGTEAPWPRTVARRVDAHVRGYEVLTASVIDNERVRIQRRFVPENAVAAISESRVRHVADRARLSERERDVLGHLLVGRALVDIAELLGISPRTVKFHQANILDKLGADSRADLIRVVT